MTFVFANLCIPFFDFLSTVQEVDQQAIEEALGIELGKEDEDEDEEQEGSLPLSYVSNEG